MQDKEVQTKAMSIDDIHHAGDTQIRVQLDMYAVNDYAEAMRNDDVFPPVDVFFDGKIHWLADGFHRIAAAKSIDRDVIGVTIHQGCKREAILFAIDANRGYGVRIRQEDKRRMVEMFLKDDEWVQWSDAEIARKCAVHQTTVSRIRESILCNALDTPKPKRKRKVKRKGKTYEMDTTNIGNGSENDKPEPEAAPELPLGAVDKPTEDSQSEPELPLNEPESEAEEPLELEPMPIAVINGDAQYLSDHINEPVHLVITSPPYNVGIDYDIHSDDISTYIPLITSVWRECHKVMVEGGRICVVVPFGVGRNPYVPFDCQIMQTLQDVGFTLRGRIVWDKNTTGNRTSWGSYRMASNPSIRDTTECVIVAHKGDAKLAIPDEYKGQDDKGTYTAWLEDSNYFMELAQDHWTISPESAQRVKHPAPFPVELVRRLVHFYGYPGCHVLDPFAGSGTVGVAAKELGCKGALFEISQEYCELAERRIHGN